jgi:hypothetical protein
MPELLEDASSQQYEIEIVHSRNEGVIACPIAGEEQAVSLIRLHSPIEFLSVYWSATKEGAPPILPSHDSFLTNYNRVFLGGHRHGVVIPTTNAHLWAAAGVFHYVVYEPEGMLSKFPLSKMPWEGTSVEDFYVPVENFQIGIVNPMAALTDENGNIIDYKFTTPPEDVVALNALLR